MAPRARLRPRVRVPPRARAVNLRRWLTPGIGVKRWLARRVPRPARARGRRRARPAPGHRRPRARGTPARPRRPRHPPVAAVPAAGPIAGVLGRRRCSLYGAYRLVRALVDPFGAVGPRPADGRGDLPEAVPRPRPARRRDRRRDRAVDAPARAQGAHLQPDGGRDRRRRRRLVGRAARPSSGSRPSATSATASSRSPTPSR